RTYADAESALRRAMTLPGGDTPLAHVWLGLSLAGQRRLDDSLPALERAVALRPTFAAGWLRLGDAKEARARESGAGVAAARLATIADYRRALAVEPSTTDAYVALARALRESGDDAAAREAVALGKLYARRPEAVAAAEAGSSATSGN